MTPSFVTGCSLVSAAGDGTAATLAALRGETSGLRKNDFQGTTPQTFIGRVDGLEAAGVWPALSEYDCRNNRLAERALRADAFADVAARARDVYGASRVGVFVGTTSSGILETEIAYRHRDAATGSLPSGIHFDGSFNLFSAAAYVRERLELAGPAVSVSAACASSAKAFASARRAMAAGLCDAAIVGGVETLCLTTMHGFAALGLLSTTPCRPCDAERDGISLGEAAGFALLEPRDAAATGLVLLGYGESSDAFHLSTPHPEGAGAAIALRSALAMAAVDAADVGYVNLHGTGTRTNDAAEDIAVCAVLGPDVARSSTKGWTGHTLGAAGIVEAVITLLALRDGFLPGTLNTATIDPAIRGNVLVGGSERRIECAVSNSFGFGGSNCSLVFGRIP